MPVSLDLGDPDQRDLDPSIRTRRHDQERHQDVKSVTTQRQPSLLNSGPRNAL